MAQKFDLIIVGRGVAAQVFLDYLGKRKKQLKILGLHAPKLAPPCSLFTTSIISQNGVTKNNSQLGDWLYDAHAEAAAFMRTRRPAGVTACRQYHLRFAKDGKSKTDLARRFLTAPKIHAIREINFSVPPDALAFSEEAYCLAAIDFLNWFDRENHLSFSPPLMWREDFVNEVFQDGVTTLSGARYFADKIVFATGAAKDYLFHAEMKPLAKRVPGSYLQIGWDLGDKSFILSCKGMNLVYRHTDQIILLGGTTQLDGVEAIDWCGLQDYLQKARELIPSLPAFDHWQSFSGIRQKGEKRLPYWGPCNVHGDRHYEISSLYKNGFSLAFLAGAELSRLI